MINGINETISLISERIVNGFLENSSEDGNKYYLFQYNEDEVEFPGKSPLDEITGFCLYGIRAELLDFITIIYIGKSEDNITRLRQHLTGRNKNGSILAKSVNCKYGDILKLYKAGYKLTLCCNKNPGFKKESLVAIESKAIQISKKDFDEKIKKYEHRIKHLNRRNG